MNRQIKNEEMIILVTKYLQDNGYSKTLKTFQKETAKYNIDYSEMNSIKDLNWILNDYFRLRSEEIGKQELSHSISLSYGPEIERMYKQLETILSDYSQYRKLIETQIHHINETYETTENPPSPIVEPESTPLPDQVDDNSTSLMNSQLDPVDLPMEQYLHLYRTLPTILPDMINQSLTRNQVIDDAAIDSILNTLEENTVFAEHAILPPQGKNTTVQQNTNTRSRKSTPKKREFKETTFVSKRLNTDTTHSSPSSLQPE